MTPSIQSVLAAKGVNPTAEHLEKLETKWAELQEVKHDYTTAGLNDADIALRNIPGGDHNE